MPVLVAFQAHGGFNTLNSMLEVFFNEMNREPHPTDSKSKIASFGMRKILELYALVVNGKSINDSANLFSLLPRTGDRRSEFPVAQQLVVELRAAILPVVHMLWSSKLIEKASDSILTRVIDVLKSICAADNEYRGDKVSPHPLTCIISFRSKMLTGLQPPRYEPFKAAKIPFNWDTARSSVEQLISQGYDEDLAREAIFRTNNSVTPASEYCKAYKDGLARTRNPIPPDDSYTPAASTINGSSERQQRANAANTNVPGIADAAWDDAMSVDVPPFVPRPELDEFPGDAILGQNGDQSSQGSEESSNRETPGAMTASQLIDITNDTEGSEQPGQDLPATKDNLDKERENLRSELVGRCMEIIQAHPTSAIEISDLVRDVVLRSSTDEIREEVGAILANALSSLKTDDAGTSLNAQSVQAYAHLLALLLQDKKFFECNIETLSDKVDEYIGFLKTTLNNTTQELPSWIPDMLLILEILLAEGEQSPEAQWKPPTNVTDPIQPFELPPRNQIVNNDQCIGLFDYIVEILPRIGKDKTFAICVLRVLVILTRQRSLAQKIGDERNLQRLFVLTKQLAGAGSDCLKDSRITSSIMNILRHIVEDEDTLKQYMRAEIRTAVESRQRSQMRMDVSSYVRTLATVALRAPDLFLEVTNEMLQAHLWQSTASDPNSRTWTLELKDSRADASSAVDIEQGEGAKKLVDESSTKDVKPSTEEADKETNGTPKATRPVLENPDGVVHFLLTELLKYREVDDKEPSAPIGDTKDLGSPSLADPQGNLSDIEPFVDGKAKDKKTAKPTFQTEEHPIFVYRCFLLHCLSELLQSYTRAKVEFINFKRKVPMQTNTPVKPRSSVLNYLINDLLCQGNSGENSDTIVSKKKAATSSQAQDVLVALVLTTSEKATDSRIREKYEYDDEPDLLFVRRFVLDTVLKAYERASTPDEPIETRYSKMQCLAELMNQMIGERGKDPLTSTRSGDFSVHLHSQSQLRRMMYEKGYLDRLTSSIAEIDLSYPNIKKAIKCILQVLQILTYTAKELSHSTVMPSTSLLENVEDDFASASSLSDLDDREETPDLYRNSALGMLEHRDEDEESEDEDGRLSFCSPLPASHRFYMTPLLFLMLTITQTTRRCTMTNTAMRWTTPKMSYQPTEKKTSAMTMMSSKV
jgi:E3 ubiquitin-protein ligase HUWE1